jgi:hypothetical protein
VSYAREKLEQSVYKLAIGEGEIRERIRSILKYISPLTESDFPEPLREDWISIMSRLTEKTSKVQGTKYDEGNFEATLYGMRKTKASQIAKDLVSLNDNLNSYISDGLWR